MSKPQNPLLLLLIIHSGFGCFVAYDTIGALAPVLKKEMDMSNTQIGILYSCYSAGSILLSLVCGVMIDKFGAQRILILTTILNTLGTAIVAASSTFSIMLCGQLLYGLGSAPLYITIITTLETWFQSHPRHSLYTTVWICVSAFWLRLGSFLAFTLMPLIEQSYNFRVALWVSCGTCFSSLLTSLLYYGLYKQPEPYQNMEETENHDISKKPAVQQIKTEVQLLGKNIKNFASSFWCLAFIYVIAIPSIYSFSAFGTIILVENHGMSLPDAAFTTSLISLTNAVTSPVVGTFVGYFGRRTYFALLASAALTTTYLSFMFGWIVPLGVFLSVGFVQSMLDSVLFPSIALVVKAHVAGTATGFMMWWYDIFLTFLPIIVGSLKDGVSYRGTMSVFLVAGSMTFLGSIFLKVSDSCAGNILDKRIHHVTEVIELEDVEQLPPQMVGLDQHDA